MLVALRWPSGRKVLVEDNESKFKRLAFCFHCRVLLPDIDRPPQISFMWPRITLPSCVSHCYFRTLVLQLWWQTKPPGVLGKNTKAQALCFLNEPGSLGARWYRHPPKFKKQCFRLICSKLPDSILQFPCRVNPNTNHMAVKSNFIISYVISDSRGRSEWGDPLPG